MNKKLVLVIIILFILGFLFFFSNKEEKKAVEQAPEIVIKKESKTLEIVNVEESIENKKPTKEVRASKEDVVDQSEVPNQSRREIQKKIPSFLWEMNESDCRNLTETKWRNDYDFTCDIKFKKEKGLVLTTNQSFINDKLVMYRMFTNGINEPLNFNNEKEDLKMFQFLLGDYAFMAISLDEDYKGKELQFDLESFKTALTYKDVHKSKHFKKRFHNLIESIERVMAILKSQCEEINWQKSCDILKEYGKYDLKGIANHELGRSDL